MPIVKWKFQVEYRTEVAQSHIFCELMCLKCAEHWNYITVGNKKKVFQIQTRTKTSSGNSSSNGTQRRLDVCVSHSDTVSNSWLVVIETQIFIQCSKLTIAGKYVPISSHFSTESILDLDAWIFNWCIHSNYITLDENGTFLVHSIFTFKTRLVSKLFCVLFFAKCCLVQHLCDQSVCMYWVKIIQ